MRSKITLGLGIVEEDNENEINVPTTYFVILYGERRYESTYSQPRHW
jgi:hypothetical protein